MPDPWIALIYPPVAKPAEPPAGIARMAGALRADGVGCRVIDANISGLCHLLNTVLPQNDTWSARALKHRDSHLHALRDPAGYARPDAYSRALSDLGRLLHNAGQSTAASLGLADFTHARFSPVNSADLRKAAQRPRDNPFHDYFQNHLAEEVLESGARVAGISINYLSQALCGFALIGVLRQIRPDLRIVLGGGLITSWMRQPGWKNPFEDLVDAVICGPGEKALLEMAGFRDTGKLPAPLPDYTDLTAYFYLSPGFVLPYSASDGCWWRRCAFCPEKAEKRPFRPVARSTAAAQLRHLTQQLQPRLIHLLDNAISPALLGQMVHTPPGAPWYGFVRMSPPLDDPEFCCKLAASGCVMLKLGLESGSQKVIDHMEKGIDLKTASKVLKNLGRAGIAAYVYLLFGTPAETRAEAFQTLEFTAAHSPYIDFLNLAVFNLPAHSPEAETLESRNFYAGDLALYRDFAHPFGWQRSQVRRFLEKHFKKHPAIRPIVRRDPPVFGANHAPFFTRAFGHPEKRRPMDLG
ncbi:MAG: radical SAM protein [Desulfobacteraceae bacterium]|nr:radical SAM protein [Desulfobacteraceae bacterium]